LLEVSLSEVLEERLDAMPQDAKDCWEEIKKSGKIQIRPHATFLHSKGLSDYQEL
jgi:hypothetical protein